MKTDIKNNKGILRSHRINNDNMSQYEFYSPEKDENGKYVVSSFETIKLFFPQAIGVEYFKALPNNYFHDIFKRIENRKEYDLCRMSEDDINYYRCEFSNEIVKLNRSIYYMIKKYTSIISSPDPDDINSTCKITKKAFRIFSNLPADDDETAMLMYCDFPSIDEYYERNNLFSKTLEDVESIMNSLSNIALLSRCVTHDNENSYLEFVYNIFEHMHGNPKAIFTRGIVNYTAFKFCAEGYPYNTLSERIYSVSDIPEIRNKNSLYKYYLKNLEALVNFLNDLSFSDCSCGQKLSENEFEVKALKNAYGVMIALVAMYAEKVLNDRYSSSSFMSLSPPPKEELRYGR